MLRFIYLVIVCLSLIPSLTQAKCNLADGESTSNITIPMPSKVLVSSRSYSAGEILYDSGYISGSPVTITGCTSGYLVRYLYDGALGTGSDHVDGVALLPNNPTIGIKVYAMNQGPGLEGETVVNNQMVTPGAATGDHTLTNPAYRIQLIAINGGYLQGGTNVLSTSLAHVYYDQNPSGHSDGDIASAVYLSSSTIEIVAMGCTVDTNSLNFNMGSVDLASFESDPTVEGPEKNVAMACEPGTNVSFQIDAPAETDGDTQDGSVIALSDSGDGSDATGVGVRLALRTDSSDYTYYKPGQTYTLYSSGRSNASEWSTGTAADGSEIADKGNASTFSDEANPGGAPANSTLTFRADYYKTGSTVTPGNANAAGTITFQYN